MQIRGLALPLAASLPWGPKGKCKQLNTVNKEAYALGSPAAKILENEGLVPSPHLSQNFTLDLS